MDFTEREETGCLARLSRREYTAEVPQTNSAAPRMSDADPVVAVYRDVLYHPTEPYMLAEMEALRSYRAYYFGMRRVSGLPMPPDRTFTLNSGSPLGHLRESVFKRFGVSARLTRAVARVSPALLHVQTGVDGAVALPLARRLRLPMVVTFTGFDTQASDQELRRSSLRCHVFLRNRETLLREATLMIVVSQFLRGRLLERGCPDEKIVVLYRGVDTDLFRPNPDIAREPIVLFVGRLIAVKGVKHLIAAMQSVQSQIPGAELVILGKGNHQRRLERQAKELGVRVRFLGVVPPDEVRRWMNRARLLCQPSITAPNGTMETLSNACLEAQAMGLPVVGSNYGGIRESVAHDETGLLAPEGDSAALASHIQRLLTDDVLWNRMSAAGVRRIGEQFNLNKQSLVLERLYDGVLERTRAVRSADVPAVV
jgi:colanic acid/amylovoran biosynthesis glycosyltransferase